MEELQQEALTRVRVYLRKEGLILPREPIREFYSQVFKLSGFGIGGILNFSGKKAGTMAARILKDMFGSEEVNLDTALLYVRTFLNETGVCEVSEIKVEEGRILLRIKNSVFSQAVGESKKPVCLPLSGAFEGLFEELTGEKWKCRETGCTSQGKEFCEFLLSKS